MRRCRQTYVLRGRCKYFAHGDNDFCSWHAFLQRLRRVSDQSANDFLVGSTFIIISAGTLWGYSHTHEIFWLGATLLFASLSLREVVFCVVLTSTPLATLALWAQIIFACACWDIVIAESLTVYVCISETWALRICSILSIPSQWALALRYLVVFLLTRFLVERFLVLLNSGLLRVPTSFAKRVYDFLDIQSSLPAALVVSAIERYPASEYWSQVVGDHYWLIQAPALLTCWIVLQIYTYSTREKHEDELKEFNWKWPKGRKLALSLLVSFLCATIFAWISIVSTAYVLLLFLLVQRTCDRIFQALLVRTITNRKTDWRWRGAVILSETVRLVLLGQMINHAVRLVFLLIGVSGEAVFVTATVVSSVGAVLGTAAISYRIFVKQFFAARDRRGAEPLLPPTLSYLVEEETEAGMYNWIQEEQFGSKGRRKS